MFTIISNTNRQNKQAGFIATTAVMIVAIGVISLSLVTLSSSVAFSDFIYRKELRVQSNLNSRACLSQILLMISEDYFLSGRIDLKEFGCLSDVSNDFNGNLNVSGRADFGGVRSVFNQKVLFFDNYIELI